MQIAIATAAAAVLLPLASASCGPTAHNYMVVRLNQPGSPTSGAAACAAYNMDPLNLTTANANEVSALVFGCLGPLRYALIGSWNGVTYGVSCLQAYVSSASGGIGVAAQASCPPPQAVLCQQRGTQPIVTPTAATVTATATATGTATATSLATTTVTTTVPGTTEFTTETTTTTSVTTETATIACMPTGTSLVFITQPGVTYDTALATCQTYGYGLAFINDLTAADYGSCAPAGTTWWTQPTIANIFDSAIVTYNQAASITNMTLMTFSTAPASIAAKPMCETTNASAPYNELFSVGVTPVASSALAATVCSNANQAYALYPISDPNYTAISNSAAGLNTAWVSGLVLPVPSVCAVSAYSSLFSAYYQQMSFNTITCTGIVTNGVICTGPQL